MRRNGNDAVNKKNKKQRLSFKNDIELYFYEEEISGHITIPEEAIRQMDQKPWGLIEPSEVNCKPGDEDGWIGAAGMGHQQSLLEGLGAIAARIIQELDHRDQWRTGCNYEFS